jgi:hypothetical protein
MSGAIPLLPLYAFMTLIGTPLASLRVSSNFVHFSDVYKTHITQEKSIT